ncbi:UdgX family uracil-DNA binding protein [Mycobacterium avium]|uniref:Type-4 uracil-DNA glycosylase n=1 Tax=Mycobacterium avium subsp. hominissuis TaxID=439334 RepID=A0AAI8X465_MYCAV|nr:UdgX family uracil-DNA binding protein [Mycobacterium avium]APT12393.1 uracil-DNA glycosylase [Mycobacterium avium subsp. hominissuis]KDP04949.1 uracil-DNA glycosylase [Mycobacterium avium subsp. hominissuis 100]MBZ4572685.1 UdgX family uracil-DNA binding protein [Mycobacterium avium subsp. hominissuis]MCA2238505.1 UdgX family uracil-DNA binding protein [Mycobacterium avium]MCA2258232.1 UdgX family uracil-DNA binding protein [Mycobacterium avium]
MTATSKAPGADRYLPEQRDIEALKHAAETCRGCSLFADATQTVFGNGHPGAPIMLVGEQPGDQEDRAGAPFVGPAGRLLARALQDAGIDPGLTYQTNAVKHFKFTRKDGKRRIHQKPGRTEIVACRPWLIAEIEAVHPRVIVCLGATAAQSLLGTSFRVSTQRGQPLKLPASPEVIPDVAPEPVLVATVHPSSVLRDRSERHDEVYRLFVDDLRSARSALR